MLWKEITIGFLIAGFVALLPESFFQAIFLDDAPAALKTAQNVLVGPLIAVLSFVCSIGNIPLAAVLWAGGMSFGGVIAFIYADLITLPIVLIYRKYYGTRFALKLAAMMLAAIVIAALTVDAVFSAAGLVPESRPSIESITDRGISLNYTAVLNGIFSLVGRAAPVADDQPRRHRPGLRHARRSPADPAPRRTRRSNALLLLGKLPRGIPSRPERYT